MHPDDFEANGFAIVSDVLDGSTVAWLREQIEQVADSDATRRRGDSYFGIRNLLNVVPAIRELANSDPVRALARSLLGAEAQVVRGILFDKTPGANWKVPWHQDITIALRERKAVDGFDGWSEKAGVVHAQPPVSILQEMVTLRLHLDDSDESSGALKVIPGSHLHGRLTDQQIQEWKEKKSSFTCVAAQGSALAMRPLLLHSSSASERPEHRRVIHLDFSAQQLPGGLEWYGS